MLVLSRKESEKIIMIEKESGLRIEIAVVEVRPGYKVRLGIKAPTNVLILREELEGTHPPSE